MKTKYLFYSLAMAGMFAACSQEELVESPVLKDNVADRPVAGLVEFSTEGVESRFNYEKANGFQAGDIFGLYLMDNFVNGNAEFESEHLAEHKNANGTFWTYQNHWFDMYNFTNHIQSNYPFRYVSEGGKMVWKNDAKLVEGNYFAMFPQNEKALNRRELWHVIDPSVELKKVSSSTSDNLKYQNVENQFWLGYKQIYRDATASAEGAMKMNLDLVGVLAPLKFVINNNSNNTVILDKISFKSADGTALPTLAYVRPDRGAEKMVWNANGTNDRDAAYGWVKMDVASNEYINCDNKAHYLYNETETWTKKTIQELVDWSVPGDETIPYGLEGAATKKAYEYSFTYPADEVKLKAGVDGGSLLTTYIAIPAMESEEEWENIQVSIYGWYKDNSSSTGWTYGVLTPNKTGDDDNYSFTFVMDDSYALWGDDEQAEETDYYREVNVKFSEFSWKAVNSSVVSGTSDMENMVKSYLSQNTGKVELTIQPDENGVEITKEFVDMLKANSKNKGREIKLTFAGTRSGKVVFVDDNTMYINYKSTETDDKLIFDYTENIQLVNEANQTITGTITADVNNYGKLNVVNGSLKEVYNYTEMVVGSNTSKIGGKVEYIGNYGDLALEYNADVKELVNEPAASLNVNASVAANVKELKNKHDENCGNCVPAELTVNGKLTVGSLTNNAKLTNNGTISVVTNLNNMYHAYNAHAGYAMENNGTINGNGVVTNNGIINNYGTLSPAKVANNNCINGYKGTVKNLENAEDGVIYIKSETVDVETKNTSNGKIIFEGLINEHVGTNGVDDRIYQTIANIKGSELNEVMAKTGVTHLWLSNDVTIDYNAAGNKSLWTEEYREKVESVVVKAKKTVAIKGEATGKMLTLKNAAVSTEDKARLNIENALAVTVKSYEGNIHVGTGSSMKNAEGAAVENVDHNQIEVYSEAGLTAAVANVAEGGIVKLNADIALTSQLTVDKSMTIDLNGKTISNNTDIWNNEGAWSLISVQEGNVTIEGDGSVIAKENDCFAVDVRNGAVVNIENGTYNGNISAVYVYEGEANINGGSFTIQQLDNKVGKDSYRFLLNLYDESRKNGTAKISVTGGSFYNFNPANNLAEGIKTNFVKDGSAVTEVWKVTENGNESVFGKKTSSTKKNYEDENRADSWSYNYIYVVE